MDLIGGMGISGVMITMKCINKALNKQGKGEEWVDFVSHGLVMRHCFGMKLFSQRTFFAEDD